MIELTTNMLFLGCLVFSFVTGMIATLLLIFSPLGVKVFLWIVKILKSRAEKAPMTAESEDVIERLNKAIEKLEGLLDSKND